MGTQTILPELIATPMKMVMDSESSSTRPSSSEVYQDALKKLNALGERGKKVLDRLVKEINDRSPENEEVAKKIINEVAVKEEKRRKRDLILSSPMSEQLSNDDDEADGAVEEVFFE